MSKSNSSSSVAVIKRQLALLCYDTEDPLNALQNRDKKYYYYSWTRTYSNTCMWVFVSQLFECAKLLMNSRRRFFFFLFFSSLHSQNLTLPGDTQASNKFEYHHHETKDHWHFYMHTNYIVKPVNNSRWARIGVKNMSIGKVW